MGGLVKKGNSAKRKKHREPRRVKDPTTVVHTHAPKRRKGTKRRPPVPTPRTPSRKPLPPEQAPPPPVDGETLLSKLGRLLWRRYGGRCALCGCALVRPSQPPLPNEATIDHIVPRSRGGSNRQDNLQLACRRCNGEKAAMTMEEYRAWKTEMKTVAYVACILRGGCA